MLIVNNRLYEYTSSLASMKKWTLNDDADDADDDDDD